MCVLGGVLKNSNELIGDLKHHSQITGHRRYQRKTVSPLPGREITPKFYSVSLPRKIN